MAEKEVGHVKCTGCTALRFSELTSDLSRTGHELDADNDAFFFSDRFVEFGNQTVHRGVRLLAVGMPQCQRYRILGIQERSFRASREAEKSKCECEQQSKCFFHKDPSVWVKTYTFPAKV